MAHYQVKHCLLVLKLGNLGIIMSRVGAEFDILSTFSQKWQLFVYEKIRSNRSNLQLGLELNFVIFGLELGLSDH